MTFAKRHGRRGYHHGNLREALVLAALDLISKHGLTGFTFADAARAAGVSTSAPYRHYRDREELIADVARTGFERFTAALTQAWDGGRPDPVTAFRRVGQAYLGFAREEPAYYAAMFESGLPPDFDRELREASGKARAVLLEISEALCALLPAQGRPPAGMLSLHIWSLSHGIASLFARGDEARHKIPMAPEELLEAGMLIYLQGLGLGTTGGKGDQVGPE